MQTKQTSKIKCLHWKKYNWRTYHSYKKKEVFSGWQLHYFFSSRHIFKIVMLYSIVNTECLFHNTRQFVHSKTLDFLIANPIARIKIALFWSRYKSTKVLQTLKLFSELFIWPTFFWIYEVQKRFGIWPIWQEKSKGKIDTSQDIRHFDRVTLS